MNSKGASDAGLRIHMNRPSMLNDNLFRDGKAEPRTLGTFGAEKHFKKTLTVLFADPAAVVGDSNRQVFLRFLQGCGDGNETFSFFARIDGICNQVQNAAKDSLGVQHYLTNIVRRG